MLAGRILLIFLFLVILQTFRPTTYPPPTHAAGASVDSCVCARARYQATTHTARHPRACAICHQSLSLHATKANASGTVTARDARA